MDREFLTDEDIHGLEEDLEITVLQNKLDKANERIEELEDELKEYKIEHKIMKQILIENNLWERLLNDDRFIEHLREE